MEQLKQQLQAAGILYKENEPLSAHCTFRIGGPADLFVMPRDEDQQKRGRGFHRAHHGFCQQRVLARHRIQNGRLDIRHRGKNVYRRGTDYRLRRSCGHGGGHHLFIVAVISPHKGIRGE